eukprot:gene20717-1113_t
MHATDARDEVNVNRFFIPDGLSVTAQCIDTMFNGSDIFAKSVLNEEALEVCGNCREVGHPESQCPHPSHCYNCRAHDHKAYQCLKNAVEGAPTFFADTRCAFCGIMGHYAESCKSEGGACQNKPGAQPRKEGVGKPLILQTSKDAEVTQTCPDGHVIHNRPLQRPGTCQKCHKSKAASRQCSAGDMFCGVCLKGFQLGCVSATELELTVGISKFGSGSLVIGNCLPSLSQVQGEFSRDATLAKKLGREYLLGRINRSHIQQHKKQMERAQNEMFYDKKDQDLLAPDFLLRYLEQQGFDALKRSGTNFTVFLGKTSHRFYREKADSTRCLAREGFSTPLHTPYRSLGGKIVPPDLLISHVRFAPERERKRREREAKSGEEYRKKTMGSRRVEGVDVRPESVRLGDFEVNPKRAYKGLESSPRRPMSSPRKPPSVRGMTASPRVPT